jgi:hypothetical protein
MKRLYQAWQYDDGCVTALGEAEGIKEEIAQGLMPKDAKLLHQFEAETWEEAQTLHYIEMDWRAYKPMGEAKECPNNCGAMFYPEGSGECPNYGRIC